MRGFRSLLHQLWSDEIGVVLSAEAALLGTVAVIGASVGLGAISRSVDEELTEVAMAFRSLDQSYHFEGQRGCGAWTAGSSYEQPCVDESREELREYVEELEEHQHHSEDGRHHEEDDADERDDDARGRRESEDREEADPDEDEDEDESDDDEEDDSDESDDEDSDDDESDEDADDDGPRFRERDRDRDRDDDELTLDSPGDEFAEPTRVRPALGE